MKSEIILQGENKTILLTPENQHEKFFIEKNAILKDSKSFDVDFQFEQRRENSIDGITFNHCIIISNENSTGINFGNLPSVDQQIEDGVNKLMETECQLEEAFIVIDELELSNERLKYTIAILFLSFVATLVAIYFL